jgi:hypothetical protein
MKTRFALIIAIAAGLVVIGLDLAAVKQSIVKLQARLKGETLARQGAETELASTRWKLEETLLGLNQSKSSLQAAISERDKAAAEVNFQLKRAQELTESLSTMGQRLEETQARLARYEYTGVKPEDIAGLVGQIKKLQKELADATKEQNELKIALSSLPGDEPSPVLLPAELKGKVLTSDPKWGFVVVDAGKEQGMLPKGELLVSRNGKLVGKVKVSRVDRERSIANVVPGWELTEIIEGDLLTPAHPRS